MVEKCKDEKAESERGLTAEDHAILSRWREFVREQFRADEQRDIALLGRVEAGPGDEVTVLDVSLDKNRAPHYIDLAVGLGRRFSVSIRHDFRG